MRQYATTKGATYMREWLKKPENRAKHNARCSQSRKKNWATTQSTRRNSQLKAAFGTTLEKYNAMFEAQNGKCLICERFQSGRCKNLVVDHCHETGKVRGLLCSRCNRAIGQLEDDPNLLDKASAYLINSTRLFLETN